MVRLVRACSRAVCNNLSVINAHAGTDFINMVRAIHTQGLGPAYLLMGMPFFVAIFQRRYRAALHAFLALLVGLVGPAGMLLMGALLHPAGKSRSYLDLVLLAIGTLGIVIVVRAAKRVTPKWAMIPFFCGIAVLNIASLAFGVIELDDIFI
jgi:hypothetical protein